jgi:ketosteroid isomerase-like protein
VHRSESKAFNLFGIIDYIYKMNYYLYAFNVQVRKSILINKELFMAKSVYSLIIFLIFGFLITTAQTNEDKISIIGPPDIKLMQEINNAWATLNPVNAAKYYDKSSENVFYDVSPFEYRGWKSYLEGATEIFKTLKSMKYTVGQDAAIQVDGITAWGTATLNMETVDNYGNKNLTDLRWTVIWVKEGSDWLIVHEHLSVPATSTD